MIAWSLRLLLVVVATVAVVVVTAVVVSTFSFSINFARLLPKQIDLLNNINRFSLCSSVDWSSSVRIHSKYPWEYPSAVESLICYFH